MKFIIQQTYIFLFRSSMNPLFIFLISQHGTKLKQDLKNARSNSASSKALLNSHIFASSILIFSNSFTITPK